MTESASDDTLAKAAKRIGLVTALLTVVLGINTLVTSCNSQKSEQEASLRALIAGEEGYWSAASKEVGEIAQMKVTQADGAWRIRHKLLKDRTIAHIAPFANDLAELNEPQKDAARAVASLRKQVEQALSDPTIFGESAVVVQEALIKRDETVGTVAAKTDWTPEQREIAKAAAYSVAGRENSVTLTPASKDGWDIDVFWCERTVEADAEANFQAALGAGQALAGLSRNGTKVAGQSLGRIRIKILPIAQQLPSVGRYPSSGKTISFENNRSEGPLAQALARLPGLAGFVPTANRGVSSKWYISAFACAAGTLPTGAY